MWAVYRLPDLPDGSTRTGVELDALLEPGVRVISEHAEIRDARASLVAYRQKLAEEAAWLRAQGELFGGEE